MRATVTIALAVSLTGLGLSVAANSRSGSSTLLQTVKSRLFAPWMVPAWLDLGFDHPLTSGLPEDADHEVTVSARGSGTMMRLPEPRRGEQAARWRRLARAVGGGTSEGDPVLAAAVGRAAFATVGAEDVIVRVRRLQRAPPPGPVPLKPRFDDVFSARVRLVGGEVQLVRSEPRGEVAPLVKPAGEPQAQPSTSAGDREHQP